MAEDHLIIVICFAAAIVSCSVGESLGTKLAGSGALKTHERSNELLVRTSKLPHPEYIAPHKRGKSSENDTDDEDDLDNIVKHSAEYSLYQRLLGSGRYQKHVRPVRDHHQPIKVKVGMCVMMIEEIVERDQLLTMAACIKMKWTDDFLMWKPENYDNLTWLAISSTNIWLPDIAIINSPEPHELTRKATNVDVDHRGEVGFFPSGRLATRCNLQITYFPFDWQHCEVRLESWIYPTQYLEIEMYPDDTVDLKEYYTNHQWAVAGYRVLPEVADYDGKNFSSITFTFILRRKSEYYFMYFIFPQLLLALLQTLSHTLPVEHPGRMAMLTSLFIGTSVTQAGVAVHIPKSSDSMSLLQIYMTIMSCNLVLALVVTFVMMYAVLRYPNEEPSFIAMMVAFFSIVWPGDADRRSAASIHAPAYHKRQSIIAVSRRGSSPYVHDSRSGTTSSRGRSRTPSEDRESRSTYEPITQEERAGGGSRSRSRKNKTLHTSTSCHEHRSTSSQNRQQQKADSPTMEKTMTNLRTLLQSPRQQSSSPSRQQSVSRRPDSLMVKRLTFTDNSEGDECFSYSETHNDSFRSRSSQLQMRGLVSANGSLPTCKKHDRSLKTLLGNKRQMYPVDTSPELVLGIPGGFQTMNPNVSTPTGSTPRVLENGAIGGAAKPENGGHQSHHHHHSRREGERGIVRSRSARGEAASTDDTRELKRRWLLYCVALDKTIMYANLVWNIIVPLLLFAIVPALSPHPFLNVANDS